MCVMQEIWLCFPCALVCGSVYPIVATVQPACRNYGTLRRSPEEVALKFTTWNRTEKQVSGEPGVVVMHFSNTPYHQRMRTGAVAAEAGPLEAHLDGTVMEWSSHLTQNKLQNQMRSIGLRKKPGPSK
jgi:hypothetical protein